MQIPLYLCTLHQESLAKTLEDYEPGSPNTSQVDGHRGTMHSRNMVLGLVWA